MAAVIDESVCVIDGAVASNHEARWAFTTTSCACSSLAG